MNVPARLALLADTCLAASQDLADAWNTAATGMQVPAGAAGDTAGGGRLLSAHVHATDAAAAAVGRLVAVLEADVDAVYLCAFDFSTTDEGVATSLKSTAPAPSAPQPTPGPSATPSPTGPTGPPVPSPAPGPSPSPPAVVAR